MHRLDAKILAPILVRLLGETGADRTSVDHVVASLIQTSLRAVDSHGIQLFPHYVRAARAGRINSEPRLEFEATSASTAVLDADHAFGHRAGADAIDYAIGLARKGGTGLVSVRHSSHFGAAAYFALRAANQGLLGLAFTNADSLVKAFNARTALFGTNPICFTAPLDTEEPLCLDMATSVVSWNKVRGRAVSGQEIPLGWAFDGDGEPTTDPTLAKSLNPTGGYKGFGLGMMVEILCGMLASGPIANELLPMYGAPIEARRSISHFLMAIDINRFVELGAFRRRLQAFVDQIRAMPATADSVMVPGDPEKRAFLERSATGIPVPTAIYDSLCEVSGDIREALCG